MNRIAKAVENARTSLAKLEADKVAKLDANMAVEFDEHFAFQQQQARAHALGRLTTEEAQVIYIALGEVGSSDNGGWAAGTDTATKVAVTLVMGELLRH
jgi:hypothetical protein